MTQSISHKGVLLCGRSLDAGLRPLAQALHDAFQDRMFDVGVLDAAMGSDSLEDGIARLVTAGAKEVLCLPAMLSDAIEVKVGLSDFVQQASQAHPGVQFTLGRELAIDSQLLAAARSVLEAAEASASAPLERADTVLVVVGRGSVDPDLNSNLFKVARMLWEGMGYGWMEVAFAEGASPSLPDALDKADKLGFAHQVVLPYLLFDDPLTDAIAADIEGRLGTEDKHLLALNLKSWEALVPCFVNRIKEADAGDVVMNCQLCIYREQVLGDAGQDATDPAHTH